MQVLEVDSCRGRLLPRLTPAEIGSLEALLKGAGRKRGLRQFISLVT
jgi:hypothetical protein